MLETDEDLKDVNDKVNDVVFAPAHPVRRLIPTSSFFFGSSAVDMVGILAHRPWTSHCHCAVAETNVE